MCETLYPDAFEHSLRISDRVEGESDLFQALSRLSPSLDHGCNEGLKALTCHYLHPPCTDEGIYKYGVPIACSGIM